MLCDDTSDRHTGDERLGRHIDDERERLDRHIDDEIDDEESVRHVDGERQDSVENDQSTIKGTMYCVTCIRIISVLHSWKHNLVFCFFSYCYCCSD